MTVNTKAISIKIGVKSLKSYIPKVMGHRILKFIRSVFNLTFRT